MNDHAARRPARPNLITRLWARWVMPQWLLISNAAALLGATAVTSLLGAIFWVVAARLFPVEAVGLGSALVSAMTLLGSIGILGFGTLLVGEFRHVQSGRAQLISTVLLVTAASGSALGLIFALVAPRYATDLAPLSTSAAAVIVFTVGTALTAVAMVLDQALVGLLRSDLQLWRNTVFAIIKLIALVAVGLSLTGSGNGIYSTWVVANAVSLVVLWMYFLRRQRDTATFASIRPKLSRLRGLGKTALAHHGLNLSLQIPSQIMPLIVTALLSATVNAYFYTAWMVLGFILVGPSSLTMVLYAVGAADPDRLRQKFRFTLLVSVSGCLVAYLGLLLLGHQLLSIAGGEYAREALRPLLILALGTFPLIIRVHYIALKRIQNQLAEAVRLTGFGAGIEIIGASVGALIGGLDGLAVGWLIAVCLEVLPMTRPLQQLVLSTPLEAQQLSR